MSVDEEVWRIRAEVLGIASYEKLEAQIRDNNLWLDALRKTLDAGSISEKEFAEQTKELVRDQQRLGEQVKFTKAQFDEHGKVLDRVEASAEKGKKAAKNMGGGFLELSRAVEDAQYGFKGVVNNIPSMVQQFGGGAGLAAGVSLASIAINQLIPHIESLWKAMVPPAEVNQAVDVVGNLEKKVKELGEIALRTVPEQLQFEGAKKELADLKKGLEEFQAQKKKQTPDEEALGVRAQKEIDLSKAGPEAIAEKMADLFQDRRNAGSQIIKDAQKAQQDAQRQIAEAMRFDPRLHDLRSIKDNERRLEEAQKRGLEATKLVSQQFTQNRMAAEAEYAKLLRDLKTGTGDQQKEAKDNLTKALKAIGEGAVAAKIEMPRDNEFARRAAEVKGENEDEARKLAKKVGNELAKQGMELETDMMKELGDAARDGMKNAQKGLEGDITRMRAAGATEKKVYDYLVERLTDIAKVSSPGLEAFPAKLASVVGEGARKTLLGINDKIEDSLKSVQKKIESEIIRMAGAGASDKQQFDFAIKGFTDEIAKLYPEFAKAFPDKMLEIARDASSVTLNKIDEMVKDLADIANTTKEEAKARMAQAENVKKEADIEKLAVDRMMSAIVGERHRQMKLHPELPAMTNEESRKQAQQQVEMLKGRGLHPGAIADLGAFLTQPGMAKRVGPAQQFMMGKGMDINEATQRLPVFLTELQKGRTAEGVFRQMMEHDARLQRAALGRGAKQLRRDPRALEPRGLQSVPPQAANGEGAATNGLLGMSGAQIGNQQQLIGIAGGLTNIVAQQRRVVQGQSVQINGIALAVRQLSRQGDHGPTGLMMGRS